ncbi:FkbM family methyltransferase [Amorphus orientalis]|uniref:FkbM family methyltransferase n=1 Tax=Amorphus orientalis TaxID=649198 RepID=A0AAE3VP29_9HYPH|nr:FkbM family methyltransferase [Amorphus orientalis]MDQ0316194.1 FkbM family methyltransferase [Amorphus orientalis]
MKSYAQNFEDVMLSRLFDGKTDGFYVDVGAWDPNEHSVTKHFYDLGWSGINIEPIRSRFENFVRERTRDINLNVAITKLSGEIPFFECPSEDYFSTADPAVAEVMKNKGLPIEEYAVSGVPLSTILAEHKVENIDFLKIDVEGLESEVIESIDFRQFRPTVLVIESVIQGQRPDSWEDTDAILNNQAWEESVIQSGYVFAYFDGLNRYYIEEKSQNLVKRFRLPPCVFDEIELAGQTAILQTELEKRARLITELDSAANALQKACDERLDLINRQAAHIDELNETITQITNEMEKQNGKQN